MSDFATADDVEARLGRDLTDQAEMVGFLLEAASEVVANAADTTADQVTDPPRILRFVTVEVVCRAMSNPEGLASNTEQLGEYRYSQTFRKELSSDLFLTDTEEMLVRRAILGRLSGSSNTTSMASDPVVMGSMAPSGWIYETEGS